MDLQLFKLLRVQVLQVFENSSGSGFNFSTFGFYQVQFLEFSHFFGFGFLRFGKIVQVVKVEFSGLGKLDPSLHFGYSLFGLGQLFHGLALIRSDVRSFLCEFLHKTIMLFDVLLSSLVVTFIFFKGFYSNRG